ncbi:hypothetical protein GCM10023225_15510 [Kineococcus glutinatus]|uniref:Uncharacterized protein n=1 Tax=Kineococcus glutinatus TaxID=1070872 RepID=A0ABP9HPX3_9ACTN
MQGLITGCTCGQVPAEHFGCFGAMRWRRLRHCTRSEIWARLYEMLPKGVKATGRLKPGPQWWTGHARGSKHHLLTDGSGVKLVVTQCAD